MIEQPLGVGALLVDAVRTIEVSRRRIAVVVNSCGVLVGTLTDGDVRRCLLAGGSLSTPVSEAMNASPLTAPIGSSNSYLLDLMRRRNVAALPLVDQHGVFQRLSHLTDLAPDEADQRLADFAFAVIMAGGEGTRLRPLTQSIPKPMVDIGGMPLLERQIERLAKAGIRKAYISVNYLSHIIEDYFADGGRFGLEIAYLRETKKLGTAGALSLIDEKPGKSVVVMNGDILTTSDFASLGAFHTSNSADVTVAAVDYHISIPFGVISADGPRVTALTEKPSQRFLCNAGMYAVSPRAFAEVPYDRTYNMTDLISACLSAQWPVAVFPVHEYWSDIGTAADLEKARELFATNKS